MVSPARIHSHLHADAVWFARQLLRGTALAGETDPLLSQAVPVVHLVPAEPSAPGAISQIGGRALLPPSLPWPTWDPSDVLKREAARWERRLARYLEKNPTDPSEHTPRTRSITESLRAQARAGRRGLTLLAMVDLSAVPAPELLGLSASGVLWFFADHGLYVFERASWSVLWADVDASALVMPDVPPNTNLFSTTPVGFEPGTYISGDSLLTDGTEART